MKPSIKMIASSACAGFIGTATQVVTPIILILGLMQAAPVVADEVKCKGCVDGRNIERNAITSAKIKNGTIEAADLKPHEVVKSINDIKDSVVISGGQGISIKTDSDSLIIDNTNVDIVDRLKEQLTNLEAIVDEQKRVIDRLERSIGRTVIAFYDDFELDDGGFPRQWTSVNKPSTNITIETSDLDRGNMLHWPAFNNDDDKNEIYLRDSASEMARRVSLKLRPSTGSLPNRAFFAAIEYLGITVTIQSKGVPGRLAFTSASDHSNAPLHGFFDERRWHTLSIRLDPDAGFYDVLINNEVIGGQLFTPNIRGGAGSDLTIRSIHNKHPNGLYFDDVKIEFSPTIQTIKSLKTGVLWPKNPVKRLDRQDLAQIEKIKSFKINSLESSGQDLAQAGQDLARSKTLFS